MRTVTIDDLARLERAKRFANYQMFAIAMQARRLNSDEPEDFDFRLRKWADFDYLLVTLRRLRRCADLASSVPFAKKEMRRAIRQFNHKLPRLAELRNVGEHFDDVARDKSKYDNVSRRDLEVGTIHGDSFEWLGESVNVREAVQAAKALFDAICEALRVTHSKYVPPEEDSN